MNAYEQGLAAEILQSPAYDFDHKYLAVRTLHQSLSGCDSKEQLRAVAALTALLTDKDVARERQSRLLFREAALALISLLRAGRERRVALEANAALDQVLRTAAGSCAVALAEACGTLPLGNRVSVSALPMISSPEDPPNLSLEDLVRLAGGSRGSEYRFIGRSLVVAGNRPDTLLVVKLARTDDSGAGLSAEAVWMEYLGQVVPSLPVRFDVPRPVAVAGENGFLFGLDTLPVDPPADLALHPQLRGVAFLANNEYFLYPNRPRPQGDGQWFSEILFRNAWLLGRLSSMGIVHEAVIPLFHNRTQLERREDGGRYQWDRYGRLDRWLASCAHPNFGPTGLRDFEHFSLRDKPGPDFFRFTGDHLLGLLLVAASYFRNQEPDRVGFDETGEPMDARDLFDQACLEHLVNGVFRHYYQGCVGRELAGDLPVDIRALAERMVEELGQDLHMEEVFRVVDQQEVDDERFRELLARHGRALERFDLLARGEQDIVLHTGPHLGGFNLGISIPELIDGVAVMSARCLVDRYLFSSQ